MNNINLQFEALDFLGYQLFGKASQSQKERFTKLPLDNESYNLLEKVWSDVYFGEGKIILSGVEFIEINRLLSDFTIKVSITEKVLIDYLTLVVKNESTKEIFIVLEKTYNRMLSKCSQSA